MGSGRQMRWSANGLTDYRAVRDFFEKFAGTQSLTVVVHREIRKSDFVHKAAEKTVTRCRSMIETLFGLTFACTGIGFLAMAVRHALLGMRSKTWPSVSGTIMTCDLQTSDGTYRAEIAYRYNVGEKAYAANRVFFGDRISTSWSGLPARRLVKYPIQSAVSVFYDPAHPSRAVLEPGVNLQVWLEIGIAVICSLLGAFYARYGHYLL